MKVTFIERKLNPKEISIEKLFSVVRGELYKKGILFNVKKNPFPFGLIGMIKALFYFYKNHGEINHISGDIHWVALVLKGKNTILTIHDISGLSYMKGVRKKMYYLLWFYLPVRKVRYVTAISEKTKADLVKLMPWAEHKIVIVPNCHTIEADSKEIITIENEPKILIVGTRSNKNIERIIEALNGVSCSLSIIGELSVEQQDILSENNINYQNFKFISDDELKTFYIKSDILVFASTFEGFGLPIIEAQSQDCIVITSNIEPMTEVAGKGAYFVDPFSVSSIRAGIEEVVKDKILQQQLIMNGRSNIIRYSIPEITAKYVNLYQQISTNR